MRIKSPFITNSSSTAYIVLVPNNYKLQEERMEEVFEEVSQNYSDHKKPDFTEYETCIELLKEGENIYCDDNGYGGGITRITWDVLLFLCCYDKLVLNYLDTSSDMANIMIGVTQEKVEEILLNYVDLQKIFKTCNERGAKNAKEIEK